MMVRIVLPPIYAPLPDPTRKGQILFGRVVRLVVEQADRHLREQHDEPPHADGIDQAADQQDAEHLLAMLAPAGSA